MKKIAILIITLFITTSLFGCSTNNKESGANTTNAMENAKENTSTESGTKGVMDLSHINDFWWGYNFDTKNLNNGVYRGAYIYPSELTVQFTLNKNKIEHLQYLKLGLEDKDYLKDDTFKEIRGKYEILLKYLEGKDITKTLNDLYTSDKIEGIDSTIEVGKLISAIHDAFNRGVFYNNKVE